MVETTSKLAIIVEQVLHVNESTESMTPYGNISSSLEKSLRRCQGQTFRGSHDCADTSREETEFNQ